ncbi:hypothetical protein BYT27DRAFT_7089913 [Phlegmacium glaucopus]|nr:hypothetical protein BYT27DRAFT_7089913 [Phlegmacium glaucopus]
MSNRRSFPLLHLDLLPWVFLAFIVLSPAQTSGLFQWSFGNNLFSRSLPTCVSFPIVVESLDGSTNSTGTPPYYMIAFVLGGTPVTTLIGNDMNELRWSLFEPVNSQLALSVVDANGDSGGMPPSIFTVIASEATPPCTTTPPATRDFKITTNATRDLSTCQPWRFTITGGVPPYTITIPAFDSRNVTNTTIPSGDDSFSYINRAEPGTQLFGA